jgi:hypothetical protein
MRLAKAAACILKRPQTKDFKMVKKTKGGRRAAGSSFDKTLRKRRKLYNKNVSPVK